MTLQDASLPSVRKTVTVLFCDARRVHRARRAGSTPRRFGTCMLRFFEQAGAVIEAHGGTVEKFVGDEIMAVFGMPVVHEDDVLRAVRRGRMAGPER